MSFRPLVVRERESFVEGSFFFFWRRGFFIIFFFFFIVMSPPYWREAFFSLSSKTRWKRERMGLFLWVGSSKWGACLISFGGESFIFFINVIYYLILNWMMEMDMESKYWPLINHDLMITINSKKHTKKHKLLDDLKCLKCPF